MYIPSYQIHNVLKVYSRQLSQGRFAGRERSVGEGAAADRINISAEGKRQAIIEKVAADIVDRITRFGPQDEVEHNIMNRLQDEIGRNVGFQRKDETVFVYNVIDDNNEKKTASVSVEDSSFLLKRLEELAKEAVDRNMVSGSKVSE